LRQYAWSSKAWLLKLGYIKLAVNVVGELNQKQQLQHHVVYFWAVPKMGMVTVT